MPVFGGSAARLENSTVTRAPVEARRSAERPRAVVLTYPFLSKYGNPFEVTSMLVKPSVTSITLGFGGQTNGEGETYAVAEEASLHGENKLAARSRMDEQQCGQVT